MCCKGVPFVASEMYILISSAIPAQKRATVAATVAKKRRRQYYFTSDGPHYETAEQRLFHKSQ